MARTRTMIVNIFVALVAISFLASCKDSSMYNIDELAPDTTVVVKPDTVIQKDTVKIYEPQFVDIVEGDTILRDKNGDSTTEKWDRVIISLEAIPAEAKKSQVDQAWSLREENLTKTPSYDWVGGMSEWTYNHGTLSVKDSVYAIYNGRKLPLWKPERLRVTQATVSVTDIEGGRGTKTVVDYTLSLEGATLATALQTLLTDIEEVPVIVVGYRVVSTHHDKWNSVTGSYELTCNNHVTVVEVMSDGSEGKTYDLPYISYNYWTAVGKIVAEVEDLNAVIGVPVAINSNGSVTIAGSSMSFTHSMKADKVTKGTWSHQPETCEAVAKYLTPISTTQGRVDVYHGSAKVDDFIVPITLTEKPHTPDFPGKIVWGGATDSYIDGVNVATWEGTYMHFIVLNNGAYKVYSRKVDADGWTSNDVSAAYVATITNSRAVAYIGNTAAGYSLGSCQWQDQGNWCKIVYYDYNGGVARVISEISKTIGGESSNNCRMPLRGTWANGKITVDGTTYVVTGSED